jgi:hypothetical protein
MEGGSGSGDDEEDEVVSSNISARQGVAKSFLQHQTTGGGGDGIPYTKCDQTALYTIHAAARYMWSLAK